MTQTQDKQKDILEDIPEIKKESPTEHFDIKNLVIVFGLITLLTFFIDIDALKELVVKAGVWAPLLFVFIKILTIVIAPLSGATLYPVVGLLFGFWPGMLYVGVGDFLGYTIAFSISRFFGQGAISKFVSKNENNIISKLIKKVDTPKGFLQISIPLFFIPEVLSYAAGLSKLRYFYFIIILWPIWTIASSVLVFSGVLFR